MSRKNTEQSSTGYPQEVHEVPTIAKSAWLPPRLKYHFFQISTDAVYPSELYRPDFIWRAGAKIKSAYNVEPVHNVSEFVTKMFASIHRVLVPGASLRDFELSEESTTSSLSATFGTLNITENLNNPSWLKPATNTEGQTATQVTTPTKTPLASWEVDIIPLLDGFSNILGQKKPENSFFNFSLVSSNHAHNLPVAFAFHALNNAMKYPEKYQLKGKAKNYKRIVINFDYHIDTGPLDLERLGKNVQSLGWGSALFYNKLKGKFGAVFDSIADLYISIGIKGEQKNYYNKSTGDLIPPVQFRIFDQNNIYEKTEYEATDLKLQNQADKRLKQIHSFFSLDEIKNFEAVWNHIKTQAGVNETNKALVYITWDRDVGSDGYTNWSIDFKKNPPLDRKHVITSICNCINLIKQDDGLVVGLDVTGMPDNLSGQRENSVQNKILEKNLDVLDPDPDKGAFAPAAIGGFFIKPRANRISQKALQYYFTMMGDISQVLRYLRDCKYLLDCTSPSGT